MNKTEKIIIRINCKRRKTAKRSDVRDIKTKRLKSGCVVVTSQKTIDKYPFVVIKSKKTRLSRLIYKIKYGKIPKNKCIMHKCDNTCCVNINHLKLGTPKDNIKDMVNKNRQAKGEKQHLSKLIKKQIRQIRKKHNLKIKVKYFLKNDRRNKHYKRGFYFKRKYTLKQLGCEYGVTFQEIHYIVKKKHWKHIR